MAGRPWGLLAVAPLVVVLGLAGAACSSGSSAEYCTEATEVAADNPAAVFASWNPADPAASGTGLSRAARRLRALAEAAPPEIADDVGLVAETAADLADLLTELSGADLAAALRDRAQTFTEADDASRRVTTFTRTECGIDLEAPPPSTSAPAPTTTTG